MNTISPIQPKINVSKLHKNNTNTSTNIPVEASKDEFVSSEISFKSKNLTRAVRKAPRKFMAVMSAILIEFGLKEPVVNEPQNIKPVESPESAKLRESLNKLFVRKNSVTKGFYDEPAYKNPLMIDKIVELNEKNPNLAYSLAQDFYDVEYLSDEDIIYYTDKKVNNQELIDFYNSNKAHNIYYENWTLHSTINWLKADDINPEFAKKLAMSKYCKSVHAVDVLKIERKYPENVEQIFGITNWTESFNTPADVYGLENLAKDYQNDKDLYNKMLGKFPIQKIVYLKDVFAEYPEEVFQLQISNSIEDVKKYAPVVAKMKSDSMKENLFYSGMSSRKNLEIDEKLMKDFNADDYQESLMQNAHLLDNHLGGDITTDMTSAGLKYFILELKDKTRAFERIIEDGRASRRRYNEAVNLLNLYHQYPNKKITPEMIKQYEKEPLSRLFNLE